MISDEMIEIAKKETTYSLEAHHSHNDCIRMAYQWLDAQKKIKTKCSIPHGIKNIIRQWAGRFISISDVEIAAFLHPDIHGQYPRFNISSRLTEPSIDRLKDIPEAFTHPAYRDDFDPSTYKYHE
jgi:hypothetical protein